MRCILCNNFSFIHICKTCQDTFLIPSIYKRKLSNDIEVTSFYKYKDIQDLLHTKHTDIGYYIYKILAEKSLKKFAQEFKFTSILNSIAIDDHIDSGYSHTAILNAALESDFIEPLHNKLRANNRTSYSGKSKEFRLLNPRDFQLNNIKAEELILVDDIITTGSTLTQAIQTIKQNKKEVLFCLTLADASLK